MRKVCNKCFKVVKGQQLNTHRNDCDGKLITIDDQLCDVISKLWKAGIQTEYCCAGHLDGKLFDPYIVFVLLEKDELATILDLLDEVATDDFISYRESKSIVTDMDKFDLVIYTIPHNLEDRYVPWDKRLDYQNRFIHLLYEFYTRVNRKPPA